MTGVLDRLAEHIYREDYGLFPAAVSVLDAEDRTAIDAVGPAAAGAAAAVSRRPRRRRSRLGHRRVGDLDRLLAAVADQDAPTGQGRSGRGEADPPGLAVEGAGGAEHQGAAAAA